MTVVRVKIVKDGVKGADDGATVRAYPKDGGPNKDGVYDVSEALALVFIEAKEAEEVEVKRPTATEKAKAKATKAVEKAAPEPPAAPEPAATPAAMPAMPDLKGAGSK